MNKHYSTMAFIFPMLICVCVCMKNIVQLAPVWNSRNVQDSGVMSSLLEGNHTLHLKVIHVYALSNSSKHTLERKFNKTS